MSRCVLGTDEAGYGPNLGPLVISATRWELPSGVDCQHLWQALQTAISQTAPQDGRLHVADSKTVFQPARGLATLERSVLALLGSLALAPGTDWELRQMLTHWRRPGEDEFSAAWYAEVELRLPVAADPGEIDRGRDLLCTAFAQSGCRLSAVRSDIITESRFNRLTDAAGSKGAVLTEATLTLAHSLQDAACEVQVYCDKHGGRNSYSGPLSAACNGAFVATRRESREQSVYAVGAAEYRFETQAERHLPVAAASMISKYLRELSMLAFNTWWRRHCPDVRPTQGYPQDAVRFRREVAAVRRTLPVLEDQFWRRR